MKNKKKIVAKFSEYKENIKEKKNETISRSRRRVIKIAIKLF